MLDLGMLKGCIRHWKSVLFHDGFLLSPDARVIVEHTVKYLEDYQALMQDKQAEPPAEKGG